MKRIPFLLGATGLALALFTVSCTTLGTHVKGGFACKAPQGTCAPMSNIDAQAIAGLGADAGRAMPIGTDAPDGQARFINTGGEGVPMRTGEHVMRVVFPAHTDGSGVYHEEAVAHVVSERSGWTLQPADAPAPGSLDAAIKAAAPSTAPSLPTVTASAAMPGPDTSTTPLNLREAAAGLSAPADPMPEPPHDQVAVDMTAADAAAPTAAALVAARAGHRIGDASTAAHPPAPHLQRVAARHRRPHQGVVPVHTAASGSLTAALNRAAFNRLTVVHPRSTAGQDAPHATKEVATAAAMSQAEGSRP